MDDVKGEWRKAYTDNSHTFEISEHKAYMYWRVRTEDQLKKDPEDKTRWFVALRDSREMALTLIDDGSNLSSLKLNQLDEAKKEAVRLLKIGMLHKIKLLNKQKKLLRQAANIL